MVTQNNKWTEERTKIDINSTRLDYLYRIHRSHQRLVATPMVWVGTVLHFTHSDTVCGSSLIDTLFETVDISTGNTTSFRLSAILLLKVYFMISNLNRLNIFISPNMVV